MQQFSSKVSAGNQDPLLGVIILAQGPLKTLYVSQHT